MKNAAGLTGKSGIFVGGWITSMIWPETSVTGSNIDSMKSKNSATGIVGETAAVVDRRSLIRGSLR